MTKAVEDAVTRILKSVSKEAIEKAMVDEFTARARRMAGGGPEYVVRWLIREFDIADAESKCFHAELDLRQT